MLKAKKKSKREKEEGGSELKTSIDFYTYFKELPPLSTHPSFYFYTEEKVYFCFFYTFFWGPVAQKIFFFQGNFVSIKSVV